MGNEITALMDDDSGFRRAIKVGNRNCSHLFQLVQRDTVAQIPLQIQIKFSHLENYPSKNFYFTFQPCTKSRITLSVYQKIRKSKKRNRKNEKCDSINNRDLL